ncbi:MAG: 16S rRNA (cytosine(1402)-N(4))-methyltransferase RsmH [Pseudomonadota bacterium]
MAAAAERPATQPTAGAPHIPVLLDGVLAALEPLQARTVVDGTFGAGGYTRAFLSGGASVIAVDQDPTALEAADWAAEEPALTLIEGRFGELDELASKAGADKVDAVVLDIGVSSMQLDQGVRGFSFLRDGPLDMRMSRQGPSAADLVNSADETVLADIIYNYGEDKAARRLARAIVKARGEAPIDTTLRLAEIVADALPRPRPGQAHPATRTFQALRIAVNDELGELVRGLAAAERVLAPGGVLAVVSFHSLEDRIVKRYLAEASGSAGGGSRHAPARQGPAPRYHRPASAVAPSAREIEANPRARSARLRSAVRTDAPAIDPDLRAIGLPRDPSAQAPRRGRR